MTPRHLPPGLLPALAAMIPRAEGPRPAVPVRAPFTGEEIGTVPACTEADVALAVERARAAQPAWAARPAAERKVIFMRYHDLLLHRQDTMLDLLQLEGGRARRHALEEVLDTALNSRYYAVRAGAWLKPRRRKGALPLLTATWEHRHPLGVVGIISPWNYPLTLAIADAIPALLAGNAVVLKPASETPFTALLAVKWLHEAGLPADLIQVVTGRGSIIGSALIERVEFIGFTGSTETGRGIAAQAAERLIGCSMELGGKNPMLVLNDADLDRAVDGAMRGCFSNTGQLCISIERMYVQSAIYGRFVAAFAERTRNLHLSAAYDYEGEIGTLISQEQLDKVQEHVQDAVAKGATVLTGGRARPDLGPYFYEPTILTGVTPEMQVAAEETFGPVVSIYRFDDLPDAIHAANDSRYGLNASIWTRDTALGRALAAQIECGTVNINEGYSAAYGSVDAPMGGMKDSGLGRRHGKQGMLKYTEAQTIAVQRLLPIAPLPNMTAGQFALVMTLTLFLLKRIPKLR
ncbi:MAG: succinate-semialdehyde dehydrogenase (NADP(+)) [Chloroflexi bacterium]|nr:succinate-semialdehyde dehydrogenase (NADP(+)) [Chloroflexota bacterium]